MNLTDLHLDAADHSEPVAGFYAGQMAKGAPRCPVRIWYGPPIDPETGEVMDRSHRWQAERCGVPVDVNDVWPWVIGHAISYAQYDGLMRLAEWARENCPDYFMTPAVPVGEMDMSQDFEWQITAAQFLAGDFGAAGRLRDMAPMDIARVYGCGVEIRRTANGAARLRQMEAKNE